jgi:transposase
MDFDDEELERLLYPPPAQTGTKKAQPDCAYMHKELKRKGVTLQLLWYEYKQQHPDDGYQYTQFCDYVPSSDSRLTPTRMQRCCASSSKRRSSTSW